MNCISRGKLMIIHLIFGLIKEISLYKMSDFPEVFAHSRKI